MPKGVSRLSTPEKPERRSQKGNPANTVTVLLMGAGEMPSVRTVAVWR